MTKSRRKKLFTLFLVAATLSAGLLGSVNATQQVESQHLVTGHSKYVDASSSYSGCFAGLAGLILQRVTWFNGQTLFTRAESGGDKWVYVTEHLGRDDGEYNKSTGFKVADPSEEQLYRTDNTYKFSDENQPSKDWVVREYFALREKKKNYEADNPEGDDPSYEDDDGISREKFYVFAVKVSSNAIQDPTLGKDYNFAMVIDTCRFKTAKAGDRNHSDVNGTTGSPAGQHDGEGDGNHTHDLRSVDIWVGDKPQALADGEAQVPDDRGNQSTEDDIQDGGP